MKTEYLLRFDDMTPTMDQARWQRFVPLLERFALKPILAVVPENHDPELSVSPEDPAFWQTMQAWQKRGATIGLHGYRHLCMNHGRGLVPLHRETEFAGAPEALQRSWISSGLSILRGKGLEPRIWVAPRHGSDTATVRALQSAGIELISDGLWPSPVLWHGSIWIPQQLWEPRTMPGGVWTICFHAQTAPDALVRRLESFLIENSSRFTSVDRVVAEWPMHQRGLSEWAYQEWRLAKRRIRRR